MREGYLKILRKKSRPMEETQLTKTHGSRHPAGKTLMADWEAPYLTIRTNDLVFRFAVKQQIECPG